MQFVNFRRYKSIPSSYVNGTPLWQILLEITTEADRRRANNTQNNN